MSTQTTPEQREAVQPTVTDYVIQAILHPDTPMSADYLINHGLSQESVQGLFLIRGIMHQYQVNQQVALQVAALQQKNHMDASAKDTFETISLIKKGMNHSIQSSGRIQTWTTIMYLASFFLGFGLIVAAAYSTYVSKPGGDKDWFTIAFGASGFVLVLATFFANPPRELQRVRSNYVQLSILALGWLNELVDSSVVRRSVLNTNPGDPQKIEQLQLLVGNQTNTTLCYVRMMDGFAEPQDKELLDKLYQTHLKPEAHTVPTKDLA